MTSEEIHTLVFIIFWGFTCSKPSVRFLKKSFILKNARVHPKRMTGNGQLTRGAFIINDSLRNPHFRCQRELRKLTGEISVISTYACAPEI